MSDIFHQFELVTLVPVQIGSLDLSFTNSSLAMVLASVLFMVLALVGTAQRKLAHPTRFQVALEMLYEGMEKTIISTAGGDARRFVPLIFSIFLFILLANLMGMIPGNYTPTSDIVVTFAIAAFVFLFVTILGFIRQGSHYFAVLLPKGTPLLLAPLMFVVELFAYLARPVSLSLRLAINMMAGHIILKVIAGLAAMAGLFAVMPLALLVILVGFEFFVAVLQAYIFAVLASVYLSDALNGH